MVIPAGETTGSFTLTNPNTEDVYVDPSSVSATITEVIGGKFEKTEIKQASATANIADTINDTTVSISAVDTNEKASHLEFHLKLDHLPKKDSSATITVNVEGKEYLVNVNDDGSASLVKSVKGVSVSKDIDGTIKLFVPNTFNNDDVYVDPSSVTATITDVKGGDYENVVIDTSSATAQIIDTIDTTTASIHADSIVQGKVTFTIKLSNPPQNENDAVTAKVSVVGDGVNQLINDQSVTLTKNDSGDWTGTFVVDAQGANNLTAQVTSVEGGNFEATQGLLTTVTLQDSSPTLSVDETFLASGTRDSTDAGANRVTRDLSVLFKQNVEGEADASYSLTFAPESADTGLKTIVNGNTYSVRLVKDGNNIVGRAYEAIYDSNGNFVEYAAASEAARDIFTVEINDNNILTFALTGNGSIVQDVIGVRDASTAANAAGLDEAVSLTGISVVKTVGGDTQTVVKQNLTLEFEDDAPTLASGGSDGLQYTYYANPGNPDNLKDFGPAIDFTQGEANGTNIDLSYWIASGVSLDSAMVKKEIDGSYTVQNAPSNSVVKYSPMNSDANKPQNYGLTIANGRLDKEISYNNNSTGQALVVDLDGKLAYGIDVEFGAFYTGEATSTGYKTDDTEPETALVIFYRDGVKVGEEHVESADRDGKSQYHFGEYIAGGFDKAVIAADDNGTQSNDYVIRTIDFSTEPSDAPVAVVKGTVIATAGADTFKDSAHPVMFDNSSTVITDGFEAEVAGQKVHVDINLSSGDKFIKATYNCNAGIENAPVDERTLFVGNVDSDGNWTLKQYSEFTVSASDTGEATQSTTFNLPFVTSQDLDGDYAKMEVGVQTVKDAETQNIHAFKVTIDDGLANQDHVLGFKESNNFDSAKIEVQIDSKHLYDGAEVIINVESGDNSTPHVLTWNAETNSFVGSEEDNFSQGIRFNGETGVISWNETSIPAFGKLLTISAAQSVRDEATNEVFYVSDSDYTQPEKLQVLNDDKTLSIREVGVNRGCLYISNQNGGILGDKKSCSYSWDKPTAEGWLSERGVDASGIFDTSTGFVSQAGSFAINDLPAEYGAQFSIAANQGTFEEIQEEDGTITLTYKSGICVEGVDAPEDFFKINYNPLTGEYTATLNNNLPRTEVDQWDANTPLKFTIKALVGDGDNSTQIGEKTFTFELKGANERPELHQVSVVDGTAEEVDVVYGTTGQVLSSETTAKIADELRGSDVTDKNTKYYIFTNGAENTNINRVAVDGSIDSQWARNEAGGLRYSGDELLYTEENLDTWLRDYTASKASIGTTTIGDPDRNNGFLTTPKDTTYATSVQGSHGTLSINSTTGEYTYNLNATIQGDVQGNGGIVEETFHLLVKDTKEAFDIKDITFRVVDTGDGNLVCVNGGREVMFDSEGNPQPVTITDPNTGNDIVIGTSQGDVLKGGEGADTILGGGGNDIIVYDANDTIVNGGEGVDILLGERAIDALREAETNENSSLRNVEAALAVDDATRQSLNAMSDLENTFGLSLQEGKITLVGTEGETQWVKDEDSSTYVHTTKTTDGWQWKDAQLAVDSSVSIEEKTNTVDPDAGRKGSITLQEGESIILPGDSVQGLFGTLHVDSSGSYVYQANSEALATAGISQETLTVTVDDGTGGTRTEQITFRVAVSEGENGESTVTYANGSSDMFIASGQNANTGSALPSVASNSSSATIRITAKNVTEETGDTQSVASVEVSLTPQNLDLPSETNPGPDEQGETGDTGSNEPEIVEQQPESDNGENGDGEGGDTGSTQSEAQEQQSESDNTGPSNNSEENDEEDGDAGSKQSETVDTDSLNNSEENGDTPSDDDLTDANTSSSSVTDTRTADFVTVEGQYGTLTLNTADGSYVYEARADAVVTAGGVAEESFELDVSLSQVTSATKTVTFRTAASTGDDGNVTLEYMSGESSLFTADDTNPAVVRIAADDGQSTIIMGTSAADTITGTDTADTVYAGAGDDTVNAGEGADTIYGGAGDDELNGEAGDDLIFAGAGDDTVNGGEGDDTIYGEAGEDRIFAGAGDDIVNAGEGDDTIYGEDGDDLIFAGAGNDTVDGGEGDDTIYGEAGEDVLNGEAGDDTLYGGADNDTLSGGAGNDYLNGEAGSDISSGEDGNDIVAFDENDTDITGGTGIDFLVSGEETLDSLVSKAEGKDFEVAIATDEDTSASLTNLTAIEDIGVSIDTDETGSENILIEESKPDKQEQEAPAGGESYDSSADDSAVQIAVALVQTGHGHA